LFFAEKVCAIIKPVPTVSIVQLLLLSVEQYTPSSDAAKNTPLFSNTVRTTGGCEGVIIVVDQESPSFADLYIRPPKSVAYNVSWILTISSISKNGVIGEYSFQLKPLSVEKHIPYENVETYNLPFC
jgi:hypothetical protein